VTNEEIRVELGERSYPVHVGDGILQSLSSLLTAHGHSNNVMVITDRNVAGLYLIALRRQLREGGFTIEVAIVPPGERQKSLAAASRIYTRMLQKPIDRAATVIALGGGVIGDLAGFVAATYHRGINLVQVPTTLLAQVDSAVGGKTAVNHPLGKNTIGVFYQPKFVLADIGTLRTLPRREIFCGLGEVVKYGVILDESLFSSMESNLDEVIALDPNTIRSVVSRCISLKAALVSKDERESGERIILNCGHTVGHALEAAGNFRLFKHGEAVLLGLAAESTISARMGLLASAAHERITALIERIPLKIRTHAIRMSDVLSMIPRDKKSLHGKNRFVLPVRIGETKVVEGVPSSLIKEALTSAQQIQFRTVRA